MQGLPQAAHRTARTPRGLELGLFLTLVSVRSIVANHVYFPLTTDLHDLGKLLRQHLQNGLGTRPVKSHTVGRLSAYQDTSVEAGA